MIRRLLHRMVYGRFDIDIERGVWVKCGAFRALVLDTNWACGAAALRLYGDDRKPGGIVVMPMRWLKIIDHTGWEEVY